MKLKKLTQMPEEQSLNWELPIPCNLNGMTNGPSQKLDPILVSTTVKRPLRKRKISGSKLTFKSHPKSSKSLSKREETSIHSNVTKESKRTSSTNSELITMKRAQVPGHNTRMEFSSKLDKTLTIPLTSKEKSMSMNNSLQTKSEFTSQVLRYLVAAMDSSAEDLMS